MTAVRHAPSPKSRYAPDPSVQTALRTPRILVREVLAGLVVAIGGFLAFTATQFALLSAASAPLESSAVSQSVSTASSRGWSSNSRSAHRSSAHRRGLRPFSPPAPTAAP